MSDESAPAGQLDYPTYVTGLVSWLSNRLSSGASSVYRRMFGVGVMEWRVMAHLAIEPGCTGAQIGRVIGLDKAAISRTVGVLLERGLAERVEGGTRGQHLALTGGGRDLHDRILVVAMQRERQLLSGLSEAERDALRAMLGTLLRHVPRGETEPR